MLRTAKNIRNYALMPLFVLLSLMNYAACSLLQDDYIVVSDLSTNSVDLVCADSSTSLVEASYFSYPDGYSTLTGFRDY